MRVYGSADLNNKYLVCGFLMSLILLVCSFFGFEDKDNPLVSSVGVLESYSFSRGGDFSLMLKDQEDQSYKEFNFLQFRSYLDGKIGFYQGRVIRIDHYGDYIADCWLGSKQFCFSKCDSDRTCRLSQNKSAALWLRSIAALIAFFTLSAFLWRCSKRR